MSIRKALTENTEALDRLASAIDALTAPICVACVGDGFNPDGGLCLRCQGSGIDPDPLAPTGIGGAR